MEIDLIIINFNTAQLTIGCIESAYKYSGGFKINPVVVDNYSDTNDIQLIKDKFPNIKLIQLKENLGYAKAINVGVENSSSDYLLLSNSDIVFLEKSIEELFQPIIEKKADITGPQQLFPDFSWQESYSIFPGIRLGLADFSLYRTIRRNILRKFYGKVALDTKTKIVDFVDGALIACTRDIFKNAGGFDEDFFFYSEETAFCYNAHLKGGRIYFVPDSKIIHYRGASSGGFKIKPEREINVINSKLKFCRKFRSKFETKLFIMLEANFYLLLGLIAKFIKPHKKAIGTDQYLELYKLWKNAKYEE